MTILNFILGSALTAAWMYWTQVRPWRDNAEQATEGFRKCLAMLKTSQEGQRKAYTMVERALAAADAYRALTGKPRPLVVVEYDDGPEVKCIEAEGRITVTKHHAHDPLWLAIGDKSFTAKAEGSRVVLVDDDFPSPASLAPTER